MSLSIVKILVLGCIGAGVYFAALPQAEIAMQIKLEDLPRVLQSFEVCYLQDEPLKRNRPIQQFVSNNSDATIKIKAHLVRLPEDGKPTQYMDLKFWFLMNVALDEERHLLTLIGKCFSLILDLERDHYPTSNDNDAYELVHISGKSRPAFSVKRILFSNDQKTGHCEVHQPNFGSFVPADEYFSCPSEQTFACLRTQLTEEEKARQPNKFDLLVIEHLEFGFNSYNANPTGDHLSKSMKKCDLV